jgi:hypothetical protein
MGGDGRILIYGILIYSIKGLLCLELREGSLSSESRDSLQREPPFYFSLFGNRQDNQLRRLDNPNNPFE